MKSCVICSAKDSKYKCPICKNHYCSIKCCKTHKENSCAAPIEDTVEQQEIHFLTEDTVPDTKLKLLNSNEIKDLLSNPNLRQYLQQLDSASNPERAITKAMLDPLFIEFADACLKIINPPDQETDIYNKLESNTLI